MESPLELNPLEGMDDPSKPLRSKVAAVPKYREQYLRNVRELAEKSLDWTSLGQCVTSQASLIDDAVKTETRRLGTYEAFVAATAEAPNDSSEAKPKMRGGHGAMNLKEGSSRNFVALENWFFDRIKHCRQKATRFGRNADHFAGFTWLALRMADMLMTDMI